MKKSTILFVMLFIVGKCFAQFATFEPIINEMPGSMSGSRSSGDVGSTSQVTGYILDENGFVDKKVKLKVVVSNTAYGESIKITGYYNVIPGFSANWVSTSVSAQPIGGQSPITAQQKVAYANFIYWAYWNGDKIWF